MPDEVLMIGGLLRVPLEYVLRRVMAHLEQEGFSGCNPSDFFVFAHLRRTEGTRLVDLARQTQMSKQSMLYVVNRLSDEGYIERTPDPSDKRAHLLQLTPLGFQVTETARHAMREIDDDFAHLIGREQYSNLKHSLFQIAHHIEEQN